MSDNKQYGFFVDTRKCTGCKTCQIACKDKSDLTLGLNWRRVYEYCGGTWTKDDNNAFTQSVYAYYASISCNHCNKPACVEACPTGAMAKRETDGLVLVDQEVCIGCEMCAKACPYDAPQIDNERNVMTKCDGCYDRIAEGLKPSCVDSCPLRALDFDTMDNLRAKYGNGDGHIAPLPPAAETDPNLILLANPNGQPAGAGTGSVVNPAEV
ncbi:DMSO/selenate family reductase complex B subunit [Paraferrimonas sedimenticola]|uniref:Dimethylsulfoxide reductase, chain B n=1 Tax=Paraferrimonas sedimenticola TaxID=375674 RepID=A0AA37RXS1_9GAMM|nr:DMSO/selenate family reductase complex B subunit [Paraferrimonas sedimenticola]GLP97095.1 dimethylsulfoxide reductase, chain B [Paraferrimonas sedimenticola]